MADSSTLVDRVKMFVESSGTGPFQLGNAVPAFRGSEALTDGLTYSYAVESGSDYEVGQGVYVSAVDQLLRAPTLSSANGAPVNFPANVTINFTALAADLVAGLAGSGTVTSVQGNGGTTGLTLTGGPITGAGTLTIGGVLGVANGGTAGTTEAEARAGIGLGNVDDTSDADKPISEATQAALDDKASLSDLALATGAGLVGTKQTGANTATRTELAKNNDIVSLADFTGIDMTGATNSTTGFTNAIADGRALMMPSGRVVINDNLVLSADTVHLEGQGETSILDFSGGGSLSLSVVPTSIPDLSANLAAGENLVTFGSAHTLAKGDVLILFDPADSSFAVFPDRENYHDGAMFRIAAVPTSTTAIIYGVAHRSFTAANLDCYKMTAGKVVLKNFRIIPPPTGIGLQVDGHQVVIAHDLLCDEGAANTALEIFRCFDFSIARVESTCNNTDAYPLALVNCQVGRVSECSLYSVRHSISMGGRGGICTVPCRDITVINNTLLNDATQGIGAADCHGNCEDIVFAENTLNAALNPSGLNISVINNHIYGRPPSVAADGGCVYSSEIVGGVFKFIGNTFYTWGDGTNFGTVHLGIQGRNRDFTLFAHDNEIVSRGSGAANVRMFTLELGSSEGSFRVDTDIQGVRYSGSAAFAVLGIAGAANISAISSHIIDGITAPSGTLLVAASNTANYAAPMRLQQQQGSLTLSVTTGTERTVASPITLRYPYPRVPNGGATATGQAVGDKLPQGSLFSLSATQIRPQIASASATNFTATADRVVSWWCGLSDL